MKQYLFICIAFLSAAFTYDPLPSWNEGTAKKAIIQFIETTLNPNDPNYVEPNERIAVFDQDGTLWVEQPMYTQVVYSKDHASNQSLSLSLQKKLQNSSPPWTDFSINDMTQLVLSACSGMSVKEFSNDVKAWLDTAKHPRFQKLYTSLIYQPMLDVLHYFQDNGYRTYIVTGGQQDFVRVYSKQVYRIPPELVCGSLLDVQFTYDKNGIPTLIEKPKVLLNDNFSGKPEGIHFMIGKRPFAAFGNSTGDQQMLEYTGAGDKMRLMMLVLHDDAIREYAYGPAQNLPNSLVGTFTQKLYDEAEKKGWIVISMKNDWKQIFPSD